MAAPSPPDATPAAKKAPCACSPRAGSRRGREARDRVRRRLGQGSPGQGPGNAVIGRPKILVSGRVPSPSSIARPARERPRTLLSAALPFFLGPELGECPRSLQASRARVRGVVPDDDADPQAA